MTLSLNRLALPKGVKLVCELCNETAYVQCRYCNVTNYCSKIHQEVDWQAIHRQICYNLKILRQPLPPVVFKEERISQEAELLAEKVRIINLTMETAQRFLYEGRQDMMVLASAQQCLRLSINMYGGADLHLVNPLILLAEACIGMNKLRRAEEYLAQASWNVVKNGNASSALKSRLHRSLGCLYSASNRPADARRELAEDIYQATEAYGPDDVHTAAGYYYLAEVFFWQGKRLIADSLYHQVTKLYLTELLRIFKYQNRSGLEPLGVGPGIIIDNEPVVHDLDELQKSEAKSLLSAILDLRRKQTRCAPREMLMVYLALAILYFLRGRVTEVSH